MADIILLLCVALSLFLKPQRTHRLGKTENCLLYFTIYSLLVTILSLMIGKWFDIAWLHRVVRFMLYVSCILIFTSTDLFDRNVFFKNIGYFVWCLFLGIVFQYIAYYGTGRYIKLYGNFLPLMTEEILDVDFLHIFSYSAFRPSSFLTEPSHIAQIAIVPLIYNLYAENECERKKSRVLSLVTVGLILLSKSLWGYFFLIFVVGVWLLDASKKKHSGAWYVLVPVLTGALLLAFITSSFWSETFSRLDLHNLQGSMAFSGRFTGYNAFFKLPFLRIVLGSGFGAEISQQISNSVLFILVGEGIIGILLVFIALISIIVNANEKWKRTLCLSFCILLFGANVFFSHSVIIYFSLLLEQGFLKKDNCSR